MERPHVLPALALAEMAEAPGHANDVKRWRETAGALGDFHTDANGMLLRGVRKVGNNFHVVLKKGQFLEATLPKLQSIPLAPTNVAEPVVIKDTLPALR